MKRDQAVRESNPHIYHYSGITRKDIKGRTRMEHQVVLRLVKLLDIIFVCVPFILVWMYYYSEQMKIPYYRMGNYLIIFLFFSMYYLIAHLYEGFLIQISSISEIVYAQVLSIVLTNFFIYIIMWLLLFELPNVLWLLLSLVVQILIIVCWAYFSHRWYFKHYPTKKAVVIYDNQRDIDALLNEGGMKSHFDVIGVINVRDMVSEKVDERNPLEDLRIEKAVDRAEFVFMYGLHSHERNQIAKYCIANDIVTYTIPRVGDVIMASAQKMHLFHLPMLRLSHYNPTPEYLVLKRFFDILLSGIALIILSPLMVVLALIIRSDGGTAFYRQKRLTKDGKVFEVLKFRSMRMDAEKDGVARLSTGDKDPRITKVGHFIRACRMDELPQLINILKGDMSIVGPRPERPEIAQQYKEFLPEFDLRLQCKCGLTGYAQVYGKYNTTPYDKLLMDLMYISQPSLAEDFKICLATVKILFMPESTEGVSEGQTTAMSGKK